MTLEKPQIVTHIQKSLTYTPYDVKWIPCSARFVVLGQHARGTGALEVFELDGADAKLVSQAEKPHAFKCGTFGASPLHDRHLATGDFEGRLCTWDLERTELPVYSVRAHEQIINCIDGCGGVGVKTGPPEIATGSRDGTVKIWDPRQKDKPVAKISPTKGEPARDTWTVAFGNSFNDEERVIAAGYENGDVKMFDLRSMSLLWETNIKNGVCSIEFDRKDIQMNKMVVTSLESSFQAYDLRTKHPEEGFASVTEKAHDNTTVWAVRHLPQNRDVFITSGGNGDLNLYKYKYPPARSRKDDKNIHSLGVAGTVELLNKAHVAEQPVSALDWSPDKQGLCVFAAFDQAVRVGIVTKLGSI
ncbi:WD repeat-containing protein 92-like protein [Blyttiomyces helicus]|uniref:Dynein axonemal assembly factor 10 n=1 Tax=Blyttiomyces helicus TaxID=388810 RepID=A0A4P9WPG9_9FUNG|nr:WD repeat-containing protein 92-like protein [Blyttiomyces helicus]|eukprot:RKO94023.1 WD repeat-containing protein 92-like protein [Blyttiomyces helicus]